MRFETFRLASPTGADLAVYHYPAVSRPGGLLLVSHGLSEHARRYAAFAQSMAGHGWQVYAHDHRGHGDTRAAGAPPGRFATRDGPALVLADLAAVRDRAATRHPGLPVVLFGHSMGGLIAMNAVQAQPKHYDGLAVWNANFHPGIAGRLAQAVLLFQRMRRGSDVPSQLLSDLTFGAWARRMRNPRTPFDWLSRDPAAVDAYIADPLCGGEASISLWIDLFRLTYAGASRKQIARIDPGLPVHLAVGGQDPATQDGRAITWFGERLTACGLRNVTTVLYPEARHETLNDLGRRQAIGDLAAWCNGIIEANHRKQGRS